ncbi:MAG: RteC domain-containing protein [Flavobacteriaceae bacterium]|nr:RteC domain-containing protein [Flavobacteriaceae bacterium]
MKHQPSKEDLPLLNVSEMGKNLIQMTPEVKLLLQLFPQLSFSSKKQEIKFYEDVFSSVFQYYFFYDYATSIALKVPLKRKKAKIYYQELIESFQHYRCENKLIYFQVSKDSYRTHLRKMIQMKASPENTTEAMYSLLPPLQLLHPFLHQIPLIALQELLFSLIDLGLHYFKQQLYLLSNKSKNVKAITWKKSKVNFIEIVYALYYSGAIDTKKVKLSSLTLHLSKVFNLDFSNSSLNSQWTDIKRRKNTEKCFTKTMYNVILQKIEHYNQ